ncbi:MAG: helix-turn-helix transcriptional regulator [Pseudomonadota bacterium]
METRIRQIRKARGLTLAEVAARVRPEPTSAATIGRLETGLRRVTIEWLNKIADALECSPEDLVVHENTVSAGFVSLAEQRLHSENTGYRASDELLRSLLSAPATGVTDGTGPVIRQSGPIPPAGSSPVVEVASGFGEYQSGDRILFEEWQTSVSDADIGLVLLMADRHGRLALGRLVAIEAADADNVKATLLPIRAPLPPFHVEVSKFARLRMLIRSYTPGNPE